MADAPTITIGFVPRDRSCLAPASLERLLERTPPPFRLVAVDAGMPARFREPLERLLAGAPDAELLSAGPEVGSNAARNLVLRACASDYLCLIENDCFVHEGWLAALVRACEEHPAEAAAPLLLEPRGAFEKVHFDDRLGEISRDPVTGRRVVLPRATPLESDRDAPRRETDFVEMHCVLFRRRVFERIGPFDEKQSGSRAEVDLSLALHAGEVRTVLEPASRVTFSPPPPVHPEEREAYLRYWDLAGNADDHRRIEARWDVLECPSAMGFVAGRRRICDVADPAEQLRRFHADLDAQRRAAEELAALEPADGLVVLVDDAQWIAPEIAGPRPTLPFLERDGKYWGAPPDDATAIAELERLRAERGARFVAFGWPAFWWLEHYAGFAAHLRARYARRLESERLVVFDLG